MYKPCTIKQLEEFNGLVDINYNRTIEYLEELSQEDLDSRIFFEHSIRGIKLYLQVGANINARDNNDRTLLHSIACFENEYIIDLIRFLLENGADINAKNDEGNTPLHIASKHGSIEVAQFLLDSGASKGARNNMGISAYSAFKSRVKFKKDFEEFVNILSELFED